MELNNRPMGRDPKVGALIPPLTRVEGREKRETPRCTSVGVVTFLRRGGRKEKGRACWALRIFCATERNIRRRMSVIFQKESISFFGSSKKKVVSKNIPRNEKKNDCRLDAWFWSGQKTALFPKTHYRKT